WNMAVLPDASENYEHFGGEGDALALGRTVELAAEFPASTDLVQSAHKDFAATVDLLYGAMLACTKDEDESRLIPLSYRKAAQYAAAHPSPDWLNKVSNENFSDVLNVHVHGEGDESFGAGGILDQLKEGASRLGNAFSSASTDVALRLARKKLNATVT